ncbi:CBM96 family carbohydrate-binding protein [Mucilaginibacter pallidiroseus]|uniref:CBM96 family carbohydrate-binding protein n=1 Tax=Mucilaginibacter pallidiroseus TaxID=2599295 RepID=UPI00164893FD|nr:DNRLRE domain-containing protein [Mucilaginibacter pallidiroseus]
MKNYKGHTAVALLLVSVCFQFCKKSDIKDNAGDLNANGIANVSVASLSDSTSGNVWGTAKSQPIATHEIQGEVVQGKLYIFGGFDVNKRPQWTPTKRAYVYNPLNDSWASIKSMPHEPYGTNFGGGTHVAVATDGTDIYLAGGYTSNAAGTGQIFGTKQVWKYNVVANNYTKMPDLPQALAAGQLRYLNGKLHYIGGANQSRSDTGIHLVLDLNNINAGWVTLAPLLNAVNHPGAAVFNGQIYIMGGSHNQNEASVPQRTLQVYNEQSNTWTKLADMPFGIDHILSSVVVFDDKIIVLGGQTAHNTPGKQVFSYDPATNIWSVIEPMRAAKSAGVAAILNGNIHYTGGNFSAINYRWTPKKANPAIEIVASEDAYVRNGKFASNNYGADSLIFIKGATSSSYLRAAYYKFSLVNFTEIHSATLSVYGRNIDNTNSLSLSTFGVNSDSWSEQGITFNNSPQPTSGVLSAASVDPVAKRVYFDVTEFVRAQLATDKYASFMMSDVSNKNTTAQFNSRECSNDKPILIIR